MSDVPLPRSPSPPGASEEVVRALVQARTQEFQRIVNEATSGLLSGQEFVNRLKGAGATPEEAQNCIEQYTQLRMFEENAGEIDVEGGQPESNGSNQADTATSITWGLLRAKVSHLRTATQQAGGNTRTSLSEELANLFDLSSAKGGIPASVLAKAPHLSKFFDSTSTDPHLEKTQELLSVDSPQSSQDILVNKAQFAPVDDPLPRTVWWKILLDSFVDFEKLFASMDMGYDHHDEPKDVGAGYALVKKDQAFSKWPLRTEADWI